MNKYITLLLIFSFVSLSFQTFGLVTEELDQNIRAEKWELTGWFIDQSYNYLLINDCTNQNQLGGAGVTGSETRIYKSLQLYEQTTTSVRISLNLYLNGQWSDEQFLVKLNGEVVYQSSFAAEQLDSLVTGADCNGQLLRNPIALKFDANAENLTEFQIEFTSTINSDEKLLSWGISDLKILEKYTSSKCHASCNCDSEDTDKCAYCHICTSCRQAEGTEMVGQDFCQCKTPYYRLKKGSEWECEAVPPSNDITEDDCEWQLFNQIFNIVVHSNCSLQTVNDKNFVVDILSYDWRYLSVPLSEKCENELVTNILIARDCLNYNENLDRKYIRRSGQSTAIRIPLIDVYELTDNSQLTDDRTIYQKICLAIELGNLRKVLRQHRFQIRVYTNRDQVEVFHLNVDIQYTEGCDKGQECIIVADLDTKGDICTDSTCTAFKPSNVAPKYTIGDNLFVRIQFKDNTYTKFLSVQTVKFIDDDGIYTYQKNVQWWTQQQEKGFVDVKVLLFQPYESAIVEIALKIALTRDDGTSRMRALVSTEGEIVKQNFKVSVSQPKSANAANEKSNFGPQIIFGFALSALCLLL